MITTAKALQQIRTMYETPCEPGREPSTGEPHSYEKTPGRLKPVMTREELADYLVISTVTLDREIKKGLPFFVVGSRNKRFRLTEVEAWYTIQRQIRR